jgi:hypothetical protein
MLKLKKRYLVLPLLISLFLLIFLSNKSADATIVPIATSSPATTTEVSSLKRVLLINSYDQSYRWTFELTQAVKDTFDMSGIPYNFEVENMDTKRVNDATSTRLILDQFKYKFSKFKYDIVLASDDDAFNFVLKYRDELFPNVPVVFSGVNYLQNRLNVLDGQKLISGINEDIEIEASVDIALKLQPKVKNIYFIHDNTTTGKIMGDRILKLIPKYKNDYKITVYDGSLSIEEIISNIKNIPSDSLIYLTLFTYDKNKTYYNFDELLKRMRMVTNAPIFGTWSWSLGDGIVGGKLASGHAQGDAMSEIAVRVLRGEHIDNIPVELKSPNIYAFDYKELVLRGSIINNIPPGSTIINEPESFYVKYKEYVWAGTSLFILLIALIIVLFMRNRFNTLKLTKSAAEQEKLEKMVADRTVLLESTNKKLQAEFEKTKKTEEELRQKNKEVESVNKLMVDRELKMIELNEKIKDLEEVAR